MQKSTHVSSIPGMQVLITAVEQLLEGNQGHKMDSGELLWLSVVMGIATATKLALFLFCRTFKSEIVHAYSLVSICRSHCQAYLIHLGILLTTLENNKHVLN